MAIHTRQSLRRILAKSLARPVVVIGAIGNAPTTTIQVVSELRDDGADNAKYQDSWAYYPTSGEERRIIAYTNNNGSITLHRPLPAVPSVGDAIEVHNYQPSMLHDAINAGLSRCTYMQDFALAINAQSNVYDLASFTWLIAPRQIRSVYYQLSDNSGAIIQRIEVPWYRIAHAGVSLKLYVDSPMAYSTTANLIITAYQSYPPLNDETVTQVDIKNEPWITAAMQFELYDRLIQWSTPGKENNSYKGLRVQAAARFKRFSELEMPRQSHKISFNTPPNTKYHSSAGRRYPL